MVRHENFIVNGQLYQVGPFARSGTFAKEARVEYGCQPAVPVIREMDSVASPFLFGATVIVHLDANCDGCHIGNTDRQDGL